nr:nuclear transport factor 2 family protein [Microbispora sp. GKU 823]
MKDIEELNQAFYNAIESGDLDKMSEIWIEDVPGRPAMCVHPGWPMLTGRSEVLRSWALIMANTPYIQFVLTDVQTTVLGDVAVVTCAENILTAADTDEPGFAAGRVSPPAPTCGPEPAGGCGSTTAHRFCRATTTRRIRSSDGAAGDQS